MKTKTMNALLVLVLTLVAVNCDYWTEREEFIKNEELRSLGSSVVLTPREEIVNSYLMDLKLREFDDGFANPSKFIPGRHLFDGLQDLENSRVFQFIKLLPKGGMLHGHDTALASAEYVFNLTLTFSENLYACIVNGRLMFRFFQEPTNDASCEWRPIQAFRNESSDFDDFLKTQLTLIRPDFKEVYTDINKVWSAFMELFMTVDGLICYKPVFQQYFYQALQELYDDNVMYIELRSTLPSVYDLEGNTYGPIEVAGLIKETSDRFVAAHPNFLGAKLIYAPVRNVPVTTVEEYVDTALALNEAYPNFLAGFDLVGQEDIGRPLVDFVPQLQRLEGQVKFFFHGGETNWFGTSTDFNLIDAILLGTLRIGHGYALLKHPAVMQVVKDRGIGIEICPISNQVLKLVDDVRNHPGNYFVSNDFPVVICNDDPSFWGTKGSSYDWYMAFMGMASRSADLRFLKQLAMNSLRYSAIEDKEAALSYWEQEWNHFIDNIMFPRVLRAIMLQIV